MRSTHAENTTAEVTGWPPGVGEGLQGLMLPLLGVSPVAVVAMVAVVAVMVPAGISGKALGWGGGRKAGGSLPHATPGWVVTENL